MHYIEELSQPENVLCQVEVYCLWDDNDDELDSIGACSRRDGTRYTLKIMTPRECFFCGTLWSSCRATCCMQIWTRTDNPIKCHLQNCWFFGLLVSDRDLWETNYSKPHGYVKWYTFKKVIEIYWKYVWSFITCLSNPKKSINILFLTYIFILSYH